MIAERLRFDHEDRNKHYYQKVGGYSFGERQLEIATETGVEKILIWEVDNERVLEFNITQYKKDSVATGTFQGDQNYCVPVSEAVHFWDREECQILSANGDPRTIERIHQYKQFS